MSEITFSVLELCWETELVDPRPKHHFETISPYDLFFDVQTNRIIKL